jgi:hypothetical protein
MQHYLCWYAKSLDFKVNIALGIGAGIKKYAGVEKQNRKLGKISCLHPPDEMLSQLMG